jgi:hypothetical protein
MKQYLPALGPGQTGYASEKGGFATAIGAVKANALAGMQGKIYIVQHWPHAVTLAVAKADALEAKNGRVVMVRH